MDSETISQLAQLVVQGMVSAVFIWAWSKEIKRRDDDNAQHAREREMWMKELIDLAREAYGLRSRSSEHKPVTMIEHSKS